MARILAIESDPKRKRLLAGLVREHVTAELKIADSVKAAIALMQQQLPDLILAPMLLTPADELELMAHVKQLHDAPHVQLMTVPALDMLAEPPKEERRRLFGPVFARRPAQLPPQYDRGMVGALIVDGLARARDARVEHEAMIAYRAELAAVAKTRGHALSVIRPFDGPAARMAGVEDLILESIGAREKSADERRAALRRGQHDVPWLSAIKLAWSTDISLVNISTSGVLVETGSKFTPGSTTDLHLTGPETSLVVPIRFIRSDVARIDGLGVKYHAAAAFEKEIDLGGPRRTAAASSPHALAELLASTLNNPRRNEPAHAAFVRGVRQLVGARDVQLRATPAGSGGGHETLYFDVPGDDRRTLQVVFDRNHSVTDAEFKLLKAAALLTAAALELDTPGAQSQDGPKPMKLLEERVA